MALVAKGLPKVGTDRNLLVSVPHVRHGKTAGGDVHQRSPVKERNGWPVEFLTRSIDLGSGDEFGQDLALCVDLVTRQAWNRRLIGKSGIYQLPRACRLDRRHQIPDATLVIHAVTTQTVVHKKLLPIVGLVEKKGGVGYTVRTRFPICELLLMAHSAPFNESIDVAVFHPRLFGHVPTDMCHEASQVCQVKRGVECQRATMTCLAANLSVS